MKELFSPMEKLSSSITKWFEANIWNLVILVGVIIFALLLFKILTQIVRAFLIKLKHTEEEIKMFLIVWKYSFLFVWLVIIAVILSSLYPKKLLIAGITAGFISMIIGWSLQQPITSLAAWFLLILTKPFKIGDRVIIAGIVGDVVDIRLMHVILDQVGGTVMSEERSGRKVLIPNATMFAQIIYNYTFEEAEYVLDEVPVRITYTSDWEVAEIILLEAAEQVTKDIIEKTGEKPYVRAEFSPGSEGILMRLRYQTVAVRRPEIATDIIRIIFREFAKSDKVEFCVPQAEVAYRMKDKSEFPLLPKEGEKA